MGRCTAIRRRSAAALGLAVTVAFIVGGSAPAAAQDAELADYRVGNTDWNGLSSFEILAAHGGRTVEQRDTLDLGTLGDDDVLVLVYPTTELPVDDIAAWVHGGGALLVADDFGRADRLAEVFGLTRVTPPDEAEGLLLDNPALPYFRPVGTHPLSDRVGSVAANHATALRGEGLPVFAWPDGAGLVYDLSLGDGAAVFVADASMLTNLMLPLRDNARWLANTLDRLCADRLTCRLVVVAENGAIGGAPTNADGGAFDARLQALGESLERARESRVPPSALRLASALLLAGIIVIVVAVFPWAKPAWPRAPVPPVRRRSASEFELGLRRYRGRYGTRSFVLPAALLRDTFHHLFYRTLGVAVPDHGSAGARGRRAAVDRYVRRFEPKASARRRRALVRLLDELARIPGRGAILAAMRTPLDERRLVRLHDAMTDVLDTMKQLDAWTERTRRPW